MKKIFLLLFCFALLAVPFTAIGAETIAGRIVTDTAGAQAVSGVTDTKVMLIALPDIRLVATTIPDQNGAFAFVNLEPGEYLIQVVAPGYIVSKTKVSVCVGL